MSRWRGIVGVVSLLTIGVIIGIVLDHTVILPSVMHGSSDTDDNTVMLTSLGGTVELTREQAQEIHTILQHHQETVAHTWEAMRPHLLSALDSVHEQIEAVLRPNQIEGFRQWWAEQHSSDVPHAERH